MQLGHTMATVCLLPVLTQSAQHGKTCVRHACCIPAFQEEYATPLDYDAVDRWVCTCASHAWQRSLHVSAGLVPDVLLLLRVSLRADPANTNIYIGNISPETTEATLTAHFSG